MRLEQLNYVLQVSKYQSISKTSKQIFIAQPTISAAITALEDELNVQLFNRSKSGVTLTDVGETIVNHITDIFEHVEAIKTAAYEQTGNLQGQIRIEVCKGFLSETVTKGLLGFQKTHPMVTTYLEEKRSPEIVENVCNGTINLGIIAVQSSELEGQLKRLASQNILFEPLYTDHLTPYCGKNHPLAEQPASFSTLQQYPFVAFSNMHVLPTVAYLKRAFNVEDVEVIKKLVKESDSLVTFMYERSMQDDIYTKYGLIKAIHTTDSPIVLNIGCIFLQSSILSTAEEEIIKLFKELPVSDS